MHAEGALLRAGIADLRAHDHERRPVGDGEGGVRGALDGREVVAVRDLLDVPAVAVEHLADVVREAEVRRRPEADVVRVVEADQPAEPEMPGERGRLVGDAFHQVAVAREHERSVVHDLVPGPVEARRQVPLGDRHPDGVAEALAERTRRGLDTGRVAVLGVPGRLAAKLPEQLELVERQVVAREVQQAVEQRRAVAGGEHEAVAVGPVRARRAVPHRPQEQRVADRRGAEREARVARVGLLHGVDRERADRVDGKLVEIGTAVGHATPRLLGLPWRPSG